jgi:hypothetical protein
MMENQVPGISLGDEIEMLAGEFTKLGVDAHRAVMSWMGKPNRFTGAVMRTPNEVLLYLQAEQTASAAMLGAMREPEQVTVDRNAESTPAPVNRTRQVLDKAAHVLYKARVEQAVREWREAVSQRRKAMAQWDQYVEAKREAMTAARAAKQ